MKRLLLLAAAPFISPVHAGGCDEETIRGVRDKADRRLVAPPRQDFTPRKRNSARIAGMNLLPLHCLDYYSIIIRLLREKPSSLATFATFAPASHER
jgi:hypothetical protein